MLNGTIRTLEPRHGEGQGLVEYMLILSFISLLGIFFCLSAGNDTKRLIIRSNDSLSTIS